MNTSRPGKGYVPDYLVFGISETVAELETKLSEMGFVQENPHDKDKYSEKLRTAEKVKDYLHAVLHEIDLAE